MKNFKVMYVLPVLILVAVTAFAGFAQADNNRGNDNKILGSVMASFKSSFKNDKEDARLNGSTLEVHISDAGAVLVRGAKVTGVSGNTVSATTTWGAMNLNWTVNVTSSTSLLRKQGSASMMSEFAVGDIISFTGNVTSGTSSSIVLNANVIKNWSVQKANIRSSMEGTVKSMSATTLPTTIVVTAGNNKDYTVALATNTSILNNAWAAVPLSSFTINQKVAVYGLVNDTTLTANATVLRSK